MDKLNFETPDLVAENVEKIGALFPSAVTEMRDENGKLKKGINFEVLKQLLLPDVVDGEERYEFTWVGKKAAMAEAARPITKTLRPVKEDSRDWETTENLYIEGDNLEALKILQESYLGKVKMIYIDPPYNTGNDFIYADDFMRSQEKENEQMGMYDEDENRLFKNTDSNGRFHSDWCSMMYSRVVLARNLLATGGVLIISISDAELESLRKISDEVFGECNFCGDVIWNSTKSVTNTALISVSHTYNLIYFKSMQYFIENRSEFRLPDDGDGFANPDNDPRGPWKADPFQVGGWRPNQQYEITNPHTGIKYKPNPGCSWKNDCQRFQELLADNRIVFGKTGEGGPQRKRFIWEAKERGKVTETWWDDVETTTNGTQQLKKIFDGTSVFDNPKPVGLIKRFLQLGANSNAIILDFFSGSATTAHAVMQLNAEDGGHRKFIMVQLPEPCGEKTEAYKAGYKNICEIGKERIRRAGDKIKSEHPDADLDIGFRVFRVDESNMKDVYYHPETVQQQDLFEQVSNIKEDRTDMDLLYACLLDWGVEIHLPHTQEVVEGCTVHDVDGGALMACFDEKVPVAVVEYMAKKQPLRVVFRDNAFGSDAEKINVTEIFKNISPDTKVKVL